MEHDSYSKYDAEEHGGKKRTESSRSKRPSRKKTESTTTKAPIDTSDVLIIRKAFDFSPSMSPCLFS